MATKTLYWKNAVPTGATAHRSLQEAGSVTAATTTTGWVAATNAIGQSCIQNGGVEIARTNGQWSATLRPDGTALSQTLGDGWRSELPFDGTFANTNWSFTFGFRSVTAAYTGRLKLAVRVWKSADPNGVGATELTGSRVASAATAANLSTTVDTTLTWTWTPGAAMTLRGEYLFVQVGIEVTTAGGGTTQDVDFRVDSASGYAVTTPDFVPAPPGAFEEDINTPMGAFKRLALGFAFVAGSLLTTTLAPILADAPVGAQSLEPSIEYRAKRINDDTSAGTPRPLYCSPNLLDFSQNFTSGDWESDFCTVIPNAITAPDGIALSAAQIVEDTTVTQRHCIKQINTPNVEPKGRRTLSIYCKANGRNLCLYFSGFGGNEALAVWNTTTGVRTDFGGGAYISSSSSSVVDGWFRYAITFDIETGVAQPSFIVHAVSGTNYASRLYTGDGASGLYVWGAQLQVDGLCAYQATPDSTEIVKGGTGYFSEIPKRPAIGDQWQPPPPLTLAPVIAPLPAGADQTASAPDRPRDISAWQAQQSLTLRDVVAAAAPFVPASLARAPPLRPPVATPLSVRNIAAAVAATDQIRPPLYSLQLARQINAETSLGFVPPVVAVVAPVGVGQTASAPARILGVADTSKGTAKTLLVEPLPPGADQIATPPDRQRPVVDTSRGTPKTLVADAQAPVGADQTHTAPDRIRPVTDTTRGTAKPLTQDLSAPVGADQTYTASDRVRPVTDTTRGTPKTLTADAQAPVFDPPQFAPSATPVRGWIPADTSSRQPIELQVVPQAPPPGLVAPNFGPLRAWFQPDDTTAGTPKTLLREPLPPGENAPHFVPSAKPVAGWLPADTSHGTPKTLTADRQLPFFVPAHFAPSIKSIRGWLPTDTSARVPAVLQIVPPPPPVGTVIPHFAPMRASFQLVDGTSGTPPPLLVIAGAPKIIAEAFTTMHLSNLGSGMGQQ